MKKIRFFCIIVTLVLILQCVVMPADAEDMQDISVTQGCHTVDAAIPLSGSEKLLDTAKAVLLYERNSDTLVYTYNADTPVDPSSMAKLMTALIAIEQGNLDEYLTVSDEAISSVGAGALTVKPRFEAGEDVTLRDLLYSMMVASDNDAPAVIAQRFGGSQEGFAIMMNQRARALGCTSTNFTNAHGLHDDAAYTTARDVCRILNYALDNEIFRELFTAKNYTVPATNLNEERYIITSNYMMSDEYSSRWYDKRVTGGKTGTDGNGGRCLAVTSMENDMELLAIVMGAEPVFNEIDPNMLERYGSFEEMKALLDHAGKNYRCRQVFYEGQTFSQHAVTGGSNHAIATPTADLAIMMPLKLNETDLQYKVDTDNAALTAPVKAGTPISYVEAWYGNICLARMQLVAMLDVETYVAPEEPGLSDKRVEESGGAVIAIILGVLLGIALLAFGVLFAIRSVRLAAIRRRKRRRRR